MRPRRARKILGWAMVVSALVGAIILASVLMFSSLEVGPLAQPSRPPLSSVSASPTTTTPTTEPSPSPSEIPTPVLQDTGLFMPESFNVFTERGPLSPERVPISQQAIGAKPFINPPALPAMVLASFTTLPGTGQGTAWMACHSQVSPPMACNFLTELTQADVDAGATVVLYGPGGRELVYRIVTLSLDITKGHFGESDLGKQVTAKTPGMFVGQTCDVNDADRYRIFVGELVSSAVGVAI